MSDDNNPITIEMVGIKNEREELLIKLWWNAAIEAAMQICRNRDTFESIILFDRIKELKK